MCSRIVWYGISQRQGLLQPKGYAPQPDEMGRPAKPITEQEIRLFEDTEHVRLPDDFKSYLLEYGARTFNSRRIFAFESKAEFHDGKKQTISVGAIAGPATMLETRQRYLNPIYNNSGARLPEGLYPFTFDAGYGHCLLDLNNTNYGRISYIVIKAETFGESGYGWDQVGVVAGSFSEFLAGLEPDYL